MEVVGEAADSESALEACRSIQPDVLLLDLRMPGIGGIAVCGEVTKSCPDTAVLVLTSFDEDEDIFGAAKATVRSATKAGPMFVVPPAAAVYTYVPSIATLSTQRSVYCLSHVGEPSVASSAPSHGLHVPASPTRRPPSGWRP